MTMAMEIGIHAGARNQKNPRNNPEFSILEIIDPLLNYFRYEILKS